VTLAAAEVINEIMSAHAAEPDRYNLRITNLRINEVNNERLIVGARESHFTDT
jgi:hypothetical protein